MSWVPAFAGTTGSDDDTRSQEEVLNVRQLETLFDSPDPAVKAIQTIGQIRVLFFQNAEPAFDLAHVVAQAIDRVADMARVFEDVCARLAHKVSLT